MKNDSVDKIVISYFATVTAEPFVYKGVRYDVPALTVSPLLLRGYTCPMGCGGCCRKFSLDYLPSERQPASCTPRTVVFSGRDVVIHSDAQSENASNDCKHLGQSDGRCGIHGYHPFSCDFELIRMMPTGDRAARMTQQLFSRGWNMKRIDGERGARCTMTPADPATVADVVRKLGRLTQWTDHFGLATRIPEVLRWIDAVKGDLDNIFPLKFEAGVLR